MVIWEHKYITVFSICWFTGRDMGGDMGYYHYTSLPSGRQFYVDMLQRWKLP